MHQLASEGRQRHGQELYAAVCASRGVADCVCVKKKKKSLN